MITVTQIEIFFALFWISIIGTGYYFGKIVLAKIGKNKVKTIMFSVGCFVLAFLFYVVCNKIGVI